MTRRLPAVALATVALAGCLPKTYHCSANSDCGAAGVCEPTSYCGFVDPSCASGLRYGDLSGAFTGACVGQDQDAGLADAPRDTSVPDAPPPFCDPAHEPTLVGCWEFDGNVADASGHANNGVATNVTYAAGHTGMAAVLDATSHIAVADSASLTPTSITIEGWINPTMLPTGGARMGIVDNDGQYGLFIYSDGLHCFVSATVVATVALPTNAWSHVACTYDGTTGIIYIDGVQAATMGGGTALTAGNGNGAALGGNSPTNDSLVGKLDQLRIWSAPRTAAQICRAAELATCP